MKVLLGTLVAVGALYACGPAVAGFFQIGDRDGPQFYSKDFHIGLYSFAYEARTGEKPETSLRSALYDRPVFYGQVREAKPIGERYAIQANFELRKLPTRVQIREWNEEIDKELKQANGGESE